MSFSMEQNLTRVYDFITIFRNSFGYAPSIREIMKALEIKSTSSVHLYLKKLNNKGLINIQAKNISRAIEIPNNKQNSYDTIISFIPLINSLALEKLQNPELWEKEEKIMISKKLFPCSDNHFATYMHGTDMIEAGIFDMDLIIIRSQNTANNGDIALIQTNGTLSIKRFYLEPNGDIRLISENSFVEDIITKDAEIFGIVVGIIRNKL